MGRLTKRRSLDSSEPQIHRLEQHLPGCVLWKNPCPTRDLKVGDRVWASVTWTNECTDGQMGG